MHAVEARDRIEVLAVEDERRLRELFGEMIPEMGFGCSTARTAEEAIAQMSARPAQIVMLDLQLPQMGGMELFDVIRRRWPATEVIILTAFGSLDAATRAIRLDVVDFLTKPFHLCDVEVALGRARLRVLSKSRAAQVIAAPAVVEAEPVESMRTIDQVIHDQIVEALAQHGGNRTRAARALGISRRTLHYRLKEYGIQR